MADFPFDLEGPKYRKSGSNTGAETIKSTEFVLQQGVVIALVRHEGRGEFHLELVPTEGWSKTEATIASTSTALAAGAATGATIGSILPGLGTIFGMGIGAAAGYFVGGKAGEKVAEAIAPQIYDLDHEGQLDDLHSHTSEGSRTNMPLARQTHGLEVRATGKWSVHLVQPDLNQSNEEKLVEEEQLEWFLEPGHYVLPPLKTDNTPTIAKARHKGRGEFIVRAISVDGTHETIIFDEQGQFFKDDVRTDLIPQKEYILEIFADGEWNLNFSEGY